MTSEQLAAISPEVAKHFWGDPTRKTAREIRWGRKGSKSLTKETGHWYDFEADRGGDVFDLIEVESQTDRRGAIQWLKDNGYWIESSNRRNVGRFQRRSARPTRHTPQGRIVNARHISQSLSQRKAAHKTLRVNYGTVASCSYRASDSKKLWRTSPSAQNQRRCADGLAAPFNQEV